MLHCTVTVASYIICCNASTYANINDFSHDQLGLNLLLDKIQKSHCSNIYIVDAEKHRLIVIMHSFVAPLDKPLVYSYYREGVPISPLPPPKYKSKDPLDCSNLHLKVIILTYTVLGGQLLFCSYVHEGAIGSSISAGLQPIHPGVITINCSGSEPSLQQCPSTMMNLERNCDMASVVCQGRKNTIHSHVGRYH